MYELTNLLRKIESLAEGTMYGLTNLLRKIESLTEGYHV